MELDSPATLMEIYLSPSVMLLRKLHCAQLRVLVPALDHPTDVAAATHRPCGFTGTLLSPPAMCSFEAAARGASERADLPSPCC